MTGISIVRLADKYAVATDRESMAPWLVALDQNQDGKIQKNEVQDSKGFFRCGGWVGRFGASRWRSLEKILTDSGLVDHKSLKACGKTTAKISDLPLAPAARFPAAYESLFFSLPYDWVFVFKPDVTVKKILHVLKPKGKVYHPRNGEIEVVFKSGRRAILVKNRLGQFQKVKYQDAKGGYSLLARLEFLQAFRDAGVFEKFFTENPYYQEEGQVWQKFYSPVYTSVEVPVWSLERAKEDYWKGILLFPDMHGDKRRYKALYKMLSEETLDWFALEMLSHKLQPALDDFLSAPEKSKRFAKAKERLQNYLQPFWAAYFKQIKDADDNPYYRLLLLCRKRKIRVVALDSIAPYSTASQKVTPLTIGTRNLIWAEHIPDEGRGIVFGGEAHFTRNKKVRVQDFLLDRNSERTIQRLSFHAKGA